ncbi:MAG TPA: M17 family peptidase N-terminal domain-containing protein [Myxococcota bacterium]|nr:M17 family peptidase N-terminal domain-containing protein [Myxococcota bacterium]HRY94880.1 M17 family peptidase N-terminal domain-containing protein [Myxococcota bacterium]HSA24001.1 M17 family peptidase N-terminal domain-containing protein [Myxococcota bacterium]
MKRARKPAGSAPRLRLVTLRLETLDRLGVDALVLGVCSDDRPLQGAAGLCDWRLNGRLSALVQSGAFTGAADEVLLTDTGARIGTARVLLLGLGPKGGLELAAVRRGLRQMLVVAKKACLARLALELPGLGRPNGPAPAELAALTLEVVDKAYAEVELELLVPSREQGEALLHGLGEGHAEWREEPSSPPAPA